MSLPKVEVLDAEAHLLIKIDGRMHLFIEWKNLTAIQSYESHDDKYCIDYYFQGADPVICEYPKPLWEKVLAELEKVVWA